MTALSREFKMKTILAELGAVLILLIATVAPFAGAICAGHSLSKLNLIKEIDFLQRGDLDGYIEISSDPSTSICHAPNEFYEAKNDKGFPLWNTDSGCGRPVIGDFQTLLFSLFHRYFPVAEVKLATRGILFKILAASLGTYVFARSLGISRLAAVAAGLAFALSPRCLLFAELCNNYCFYPWMLACSIWASSKICIHRSVLFALVLSACAYNMHPETFVIGTSAALITAFLRVAFSFSQKSAVESVIRSAMWTCSLAVLTFLLSAPLVIPFCEFILNGVSYKFDSVSGNHIEFMDIFTYLSNLSVPLFGGSPCIGPALSLLCLPGLLYGWRQNKTLVFVFLGSLLFSCRPGILESLFSVRPISYLLPEYTIYLVILLTCTFASFGLDGFLSASMQQARALSRRTIQISGLLMMLGIAALWLVQTPWFSEFWSDKTDWGYTSQTGDGTFSLVGITVMALVVLVSFVRAEQIRRFATALGISLVIANTIPLFLYSAVALPSNDGFWFKQDSIVSQLKTLQGNNAYRSTATGCFIFQPNTNLIFGTSDFRSTAPLHPKRYAKFIELAGIRSKYCNIYESPSRLNHLFDLASVKYVVSNTPVHSNSEGLMHAELGIGKSYEKTGVQKLVPGIRLEGAKINYFANAHEVIGDAVLTVHEHASRHNIYRIVLLDERGVRLWPSPIVLEPLENFGSKLSEHKWSIPIDAPLPSAFKGKFKVTLQVGQYISGEIKSPQVVLAEIDTRDTPQSSSNERIVRVADSGNYLQIYKNRTALPPTYLVHSIEKAIDEKKALAFLSDQKTDYSTTAIIEGIDLASPSPVRPDAAAKESVRIVDKDSDSVSLYAVTQSPCYLVLTDTFYPGWKAYVDGKPVSIHPANYAFRAVYLPAAGKHQISFVYEPDSFSLGCRMLLAGLSISLILLISALATSKRKQSVDEKKDQQSERKSISYATDNEHNPLNV